MTTYAAFKENTAYLSGDFGEKYARRLFGDDIVDALPRFVKGKNKGKIKGRLDWKKCVRGGWVGQGSSSYGAEGYVENRVNKTISAKLVIPVWGDEDELVAEWHIDYDSKKPAGTPIDWGMLDQF